MREQIAVLDGMSVVADGGYGGREFTPEAGAGANYGGGSSWHPFNPTLPSSEGLAGGVGGLSNALSLSIENYGGREFSPEAGGGANYGGGSNWHPYNPTVPSSEGLAGGLSIESVPGYAGSTVTPVPGGGANYTGGSDWSQDFPTAVSSRGLVGLRGLAQMRGVSASVLRRWVACGVLGAIRIIGITRTSGDVERIVSAVMSSGFPRRVPLTGASVGYLAALYTARRVSVPMAAATRVAAQASGACG